MNNLYSNRRNIQFSLNIYVQIVNMKFSGVMQANCSLILWSPAFACLLTYEFISLKDIIVCVEAVPQRAAYMTPPMEAVYYKQSICEEVWLPVQTVLMQLAHIIVDYHTRCCVKMSKDLGWMPRQLTALHHSFASSKVAKNSD